MAYKKVGWKDYPSTDTPINATNLDHMDAGILENAQTIGDKTKITGIGDGTVAGAIAANTAAIEQNTRSLDDTKKSVSDGKSSIASAITNNGVTTASDATFATLASKVQELATNRYNSGYNSGYAAAENNGGNCATWLYGANSSLQGLYFDANCFTQSGNALYVKKYGTYHIATTGYTIGGNVNVNGSNKYVGDISAYKGGYNVTLSPGQYIASNMNTDSSGGAGGAVCVKKVS